MNTTQKTLAALTSALVLAAGSVMAADAVQDTEGQVLKTQQRTELRTQLEEKTLLQLQQREQLKAQATDQSARLPEMTQSRTQARVQTQTRTRAQTRIQVQDGSIGSNGMGSAGGGMGKR